jgi:RND superfamily putative drug exporter
MRLRDPAGRRDRPGRFWGAVAAEVVRWRYLVLAGWVGATVLATVFLPGISSSGALGNLIPKNSAALQTEVDATRLFGLPLTSGVEVVQRDPRRFPLAVQKHAAQVAADVDQGRVHGIYGLAGALPVANTAGLLPGSRERSTTIVTFLYFRPGVSLGAQTRGAHEYVRRYLGGPQDHVVGVTGVAVARDAQGKIIVSHLPQVELATVLAIALIVGLRFRSVGAPLATLACAGVAYLVAIRVVAWAGQLAGITVPPDLEPVLLVLLLGVTTDYSVFFLAGMRGRLDEGDARLPAARRATAEFMPIIVTAGLIVAAGSAALGAARLAVLRAFGPGLALTVLIAMVVAVTLTPALIAIFGRLLFLPGRAPHPAGNWRERAAKAAARREPATLIAAGCVAGLLILTAGAFGMRLALPLIRSLPDSSEAVRAQAAVSQGFVPGILAPTEILVIGPGVAAKRAGLARLEHALAARPGVASVVGPADVPAAEARQLMVAKSGNAIRYAVIESTDPLGATAISRVRALRQDLPALARSAGLTGVHLEVGGETAISADAIDALLADLWRVALAIALVTLLLLAVFLRSLLAPLYLLAASVLALLATFGLTVWIFQGILGYDGLVYYVPVVVAVLLVSLGSDYNVFVVGRIWDEARRRPLPDAVAVAVPQASGAIGTAGLALATSFALLALVPLDQFREIAAAMALGILIDTFIVRSLLVPALVVLAGRAGRWPARGPLVRHPDLARQAADGPGPRRQAAAGLRDGHGDRRPFWNIRLFPPNGRRRPPAE